MGVVYIAAHSLNSANELMMRVAKFIRDWWIFILVSLWILLPILIGHFDSPVYVSEHRGVVYSIQRTSNRSMNPGSGDGVISIRIDSDGIVNKRVDLRRYSIGQHVRMVKYRRRLSGLIIWKMY